MTAALLTADAIAVASLEPIASGCKIATPSTEVRRRQ